MSPNPNVLSSSVLKRLSGVHFDSAATGAADDIEDTEGEVATRNRVHSNEAATRSAAFEEDDQFFMMDRIEGSDEDEANSVASITPKQFHYGQIER